MKKWILPALAFSSFVYVQNALAGDVIIENKSPYDVKVSSIGGQAKIAAGKSKTVSFKNEEMGADINIWWIKNVRELCQIFTPWDRKIIVSGKYTIQCLSRNE